MVVSIVGVGEVLRDFGLSSAAIQAKNLTAQQKSNLFWINTTIGALLAIGCFAAAPLLATFFDEHRIQPIAQVLAITFLLSGITTQFRAGLARGMKFKKLAIADVAAQAIGLAVAIACALNGAGYWSMVVQQVVQSAAILLLCATFSRWLPSLPRRCDGMRALTSFGWNLMGAQLLQYASKNMDSVLIGRQFGAEPLGFYNRASQLVTSPLNQINVPASSVAIPVLSRISEDKIRYDRFIIRGQLCLMSAIVAIFMFIAAHSNAVVETLLGANWSESATFLGILALGATFQAASYATYWVFVSKGKTAALFRYAIISRVITVAILFAGIPWGATGVAVAYAAGLAVIWPLGLLWIHFVTDAPAYKMLTNGARTLVIYGVSAGVGAVTTQALTLERGLELSVGFLVMLASLALTVAVSKSYRSDIRDVIDIVRIIRKRAVK